MSSFRSAIAAVGLAVLLGAPACAVAAPAAIELTSSQNPSAPGDAVTFTVHVSSPAGWPTGEVEILRGPDTSGPLQLDPQGVLQGTTGEPQISFGANHACAVTRAGAVRCWGTNAFGQLGDGTTTDRPEGVTVTGLDHDVVAVGVGNLSSCALTTAGAVKCWGDNAFFQLGTGTTDDSLVPVQVQGLESGVVDIVVRAVDACALMDDGALRCWGGNGEGTVGNGTRSPVDVPTAVAGLPPVRALPASVNDQFDSCVVTVANTVYCWGRNNVGQVGNGTTGDYVLAPVAVTGLTGVDTVSVGNAHACVLKFDGAVACWGWGDFGQVGDGTFTTARSTPVTVTALAADDVRAVVAGGIHSCAVLGDGTAKCWGSNAGLALGREGDGTETVASPLPVTVVASGIVAMAASEYRSVAVKSGGRLYAWGDNTGAMLGDGTTLTRALPVVVQPLVAPSVASVTIGDLPRGRTRMTSVYAGTVEFDGVGGGTVDQLVRIASATDLAAAPRSVTFGDEVALAATVSAADARTGLVTFRAGSTVLGVRPIDQDGLAVLTTTAIPAGTTTLTADYGGDDGTAPSSAAPIGVTVARASADATLVTSRRSVRPGAQVTLTATVSASTGAGAPTGVVVFRAGASTLGVRPLVGGVATLAVAMPTGTTAFTATYPGSGDFEPAAPATVAVSADAALGPEVRVSTRTRGAQEAPAVVGLAGPYAVAWQSGGQDGSSTGIYAQRFRASGAMSGGEGRVNAVVAGAQTRPAAAALGGGRWVVVWESAGEDGSGAGVFGRVYRARGGPGAAFRLSEATAGDQREPAVAALPGGGFVAAWTAGTARGGAGAVMARRFRADGRPVGGDRRVDGEAAARADQPAVAVLASGRVVVAWRSVRRGRAGQIVVRRLAGSLAPIGGGVRAATDVAHAKSAPDVTALAGGGYAVVWVSTGQDGSGAGVYAQRFTRSGGNDGVETRLSTTARGAQSQPSIAGFPGGGFAAVWTSAGEDGSGTGVYLQRVDADGGLADRALRVATTTRGDQDEPDVATLSRRAFVVAWTSEGQDGFSGGIYAQRFLLGGDASRPLP